MANEQYSSPEFYHKQFRYDSTTGRLYWKVGQRSGLLAGHLRSRENGRDRRYYIETRNDRGSRENMAAHNIIWIMHHGPIQTGVFVDHIDGDGANNLLENLRLATIGENARNRKRAHNNTSGFPGVSPYRTNKSSKPWMAYITINWKRLHLGYFRTKEEAWAARREAEIQHFGDYARKDPARQMPVIAQ